MAYNENEANKYFKTGNDFSNKGDYKTAIEYYNKAIKLVPDDSDVFYKSSYNMALAYSRLDEFDKSIKICTDLLKLKPRENPSTAVIYNEIGLGYNGLGNYKLRDVMELFNREAMGTTGNKETTPLKLLKEAVAYYDKAKEALGISAKQETREIYLARVYHNAGITCSGYAMVYDQCNFISENKKIDLLEKSLQYYNVTKENFKKAINLDPDQVEYKYQLEDCEKLIKNMQEQIIDIKNR